MKISAQTAGVGTTGLTGITLLVLHTTGFITGWTAPELSQFIDNICDKEFDNKKTQQKFYEKTGFDTRLNHMTIDNHYILADKAGDYFINQTPVDLTTGFKTNIYTKENI